VTTMQEARGKPVYSSDGERIGDVDLVMEDVETRKPEWFVIGTAKLGRKRVVPVVGSEVRGDGVYVRYSAAQVRSTPEIEGDRISQDTERTLYSQYGLEYSEERSRTGLPERRSSSRQTTPSRSRGGRQARKSTPTSRRASDETTKDELYAEAKKLDIKGRSRMNKQQLLRAVERARGSSSKGGQSRAKANPVHVQEFLEGVGYPTRKGDLVREAKRQGANKDVRSTLERLPDKRFKTPTEVSEAIGNLS
jgi:sporulation protein YlmC with PRC-barrel domain